MTELMRPSTLTLRRTSSAAPGGRTKVAAVTKAETANSADSNQRVVFSDTLLQGRTHVSIMHNGETYQLRATRLGKLILTK
ncbi:MULTISPECIES: hemin uptake protein HemP [Burkholderia]|jgi:hemin uptake protein HemP|uniref:hemin uptake protein HemP n=1 Tax=Burkholderia TaxID=32008 RepID=UPI00050FA2DB|nr:MULTISPECIES: hemin uptake protein HemP [Burkholderia]AYQ89096.1 hemin uptake protein HemP [Burkholderia gladioli]KGE05704.1 hemin transporter HemP [Burkholderia gladioli]NBI50789.1 hemin uptake protein HemP [Burkholderia sp. ISTR5]